jgi:hypothetical protein
MHFYVYELRDETGIVFYVGAGSRSCLRQHVARAYKETTRKALHVRRVLERGGFVLPVVIGDYATANEAHCEERRLIALHGLANLTNSTSGGLGLSDLIPEVREKLAAAKRGRPRTQETRAKISAYQRGRAHPWARAQALQNLEFMKRAFLGRKHTPETIAKMRAAKLGHVVSEETRQKISKTKKRNKT